jgi:hypothetical protein
VFPKLVHLPFSFTWLLLNSRGLYSGFVVAAVGIEGGTPVQDARRLI